MQITQLKGKKWAIGLDWEILAHERSIKQESKEVAEKTNCNYGLLIDYNSNVALGLSPKPSKEPSASLYLALANQESREKDSLDNFPDWIVIEEVGDEKYWMGVIKGGLPAPQYDGVFDLTTIRERFSDLTANDTYKFFSPCGEIITLFDGVKYVENKSLNELTADVKTKIKYEKLRGIPNSLVYAGLGVIALGFVIYGLSTLIEGRSIQQKAESLRKKQAEQSRIERETYEKELKNYEEEMKRLRKGAINNVLVGLAGDPNKIISYWYNNVSEHEIGTHGWKLSNIECYYNPLDVNSPIPATNEELACDYQFERNGLTTNRMLLQDYPTAKLSGNNALISKSLKGDKEALVIPHEGVLASLPNSNQWGFDMISQLQLLKIVNIDYELKPSVEVTFPGLPKPISPEERNAGKVPVPGNPEPIGYSVGEIIIKNDNIELLKELADNVDFKAVGVKKVSMTMGDLGKMNWNLTLNYYIKSTTGGMVGANSSELSNNSVPQVGVNVPQPIGPNTPTILPANTSR